MRPLKIGISGVRGVVGETFTPELVVGFAQAFGTYLDSGRILVCRDTRPSGPMVAASVFAGLLASGCDVVDLGVCPTPSMQLSIAALGAQGGISITAGHNPVGWNALKFARADGLYLNATQAEELLDVFHQGEYAKADWRGVRTAIAREDAIQRHIDAVVASVDAGAIRARRFRVAVDCCNGACSRLTPALLRTLGCEVLAINDDPSMPFPHTPEPRLDTMAQAAALVKAGHADIGFVHDSDGERLGLVDEAGEPLSEELTLPLAAEMLLAAIKPGGVAPPAPPTRSLVGPLIPHSARVARSSPLARFSPEGFAPPASPSPSPPRNRIIVTNVSTTSVVDRVAAWHDATVVRTPVGQAYISEAIVERRAVIGGEGNGSVAVPSVHPTHDAAATMAFILERLACDGGTLSKRAGDLPRLAMIKEQVAVEPHLIHTALQAFREAMPEGDVRVADLGDGIKVEWPDGWVHVRASNTESLIRVIAEAESEPRARDLVDWARDRLPV